MNPRVKSAWSKEVKGWSARVNEEEQGPGGEREDLGSRI
jgi:hypothetical protein